MRIICIGDSLTYGYGVYSDECWVELLHKNLNTNIINKGINGDTTTGILSRCSKDILKLAPSQVIVMAGTNDILLGYSIDNVIDNIKFLCQEIKNNNISPILALQPPVIENLAEIYWDKYIDYRRININLFNYINEIKTYSAKNHIDTINFYDSFIKNKDIINLYSDGIHPNKEGHKLMFQTAVNSNFIRT